jgi:hypothetical protein
MATNLLAGTVVPLTCVSALNSMHACPSLNSQTVAANKDF